MSRRTFSLADLPLPLVPAEFQFDGARLVRQLEDRLADAYGKVLAELIEALTLGPPERLAAAQAEADRWERWAASLPPDETAEDE